MKKILEFCQEYKKKIITMKKIEIIWKLIIEDIAKMIIIWEIYNWMDNNLWKLFLDDFKRYTENNFRLSNNNNI